MRKRKTPLQQYQESIREEDVQRLILDYFSLRRFTALQTSHRTKRTTCPHCGQSSYPKGGYGASYGVPDVLISHPAWPPGVFLGLEVKGPKTALSAEQKALAAGGRIHIVRSLDDAITIVTEFHDRMGKV